MKMFLWGIVIWSLLTACSNDSIFQGISQNSSYDAKISDAEIAIDNSDYDDAIMELSVMYNTTTSPDPTVGPLLASAFMGRAGVDLTNFIASFTSSGLDPLDYIAYMISPSNVTINKNGRYLDGTAVSGYLGDLSAAKSTLQALVTNGNATNNDEIQLGMASAVHFIMNMGNKTANALNETLNNPYVAAQPGIVPVPINVAAYQIYSTSTVYKQDYNTWSSVGPSSFRENVASGTVLSFQDDLININNAIIAFNKAFPKPSETNQMKDILNAFLYSALGITSDETVTDELILAYTTEEMYAYVQRLVKQQ